MKDNTEVVEHQKKPMLDPYYVFIGIFVMLIGIPLYFEIIDITNPLVCVADSKVVDIVSLEGRSATIKLENGTILEVYGSFLKQGDNYCLKYARKNEI